MVGPIAHIGVPGTSQYRVDFSPIERGMANLGTGFGGLVKSIRDEGRKKAEQMSLAEMMSYVGDGQKFLSEGVKRGIPIGTLHKMATAHSALAKKEPDSPFNNFYNPATRERKAARRGSNEAASLAAQGWLTGDPSTDKPTQRRIVKGADDFNYYDDTKERVLPNLKAPPPKRETPKITDSMRLAGEWKQATKPVRDLMRQRDLMSIGMEAAARGDMAAGSQTVLVTFQKILDPISVVRESEYARSASGQALLAQVEGAVEKLGKGGAGVTLEQLGAFARLADEAVAKLSNGRVRDERERIGRFADHYGIDRSIIFSGNLGTGAPPAPPQGQPAPTRQGNASDRFARAPWRGPPQSAPASMMSAQAQGRPPVRKELFGSEAAPRQYTSPDPGQSRMGAAGLDDFNAPGAPDAGQPGDLEQAVEYLSSMPEAEMSGLNLQTMTLTGLKALKIARQRRQQQTMAGDYIAQGIR